MTDHPEAVETSADVLIDEGISNADDPFGWIHEEVDSQVTAMSPNECLAFLQESVNGPTEYKQYLAENMEWYEIVRALAYSAYRTDLNDLLIDRDVL